MVKVEEALSSRELWLCQLVGHSSQISSAAFVCEEEIFSMNMLEFGVDIDFGFFLMHFVCFVHIHQTIHKGDNRRKMSTIGKTNLINNQWVLKSLLIAFTQRMGQHNKN